MERRICMKLICPRHLSIANGKACHGILESIPRAYRSGGYVNAPDKPNAGHVQCRTCRLPGSLDVTEYPD